MSLLGWGSCTSLFLWWGLSPITLHLLILLIHPFHFLLVHCIPYFSKSFSRRRGKEFERLKLQERLRGRLKKGLLKRNSSTSFHPDRFIWISDSFYAVLWTCFDPYSLFSSTLNSSQEYSQKFKAGVCGPKIRGKMSSHKKVWMEEPRSGISHLLGLNMRDWSSGPL